MKPETGPAALTGVPPPDEAELLRRIAIRDRSAFDVLYRAYFYRLSRFLEQITHRPYLNEEIINDTMVVVWRKAHTFNGTSRVSTWIFAIAWRTALKALTRLGAATEITADETPASAVDEPENAFVRREWRERIARALATLSAEHRAVVELTYYHGCAYREIAQIVGCPVDTVKTRMFHARRKLKELLGGEAEDTR